MKLRDGFPFLVNEKHRFLLAGIYNTGFGYASFAALYAMFGQSVHYLLLALAAHPIAVTNAFLTHRFFVFRSKGDFWPEYLRFNLTYVGTLLIGMTGLLLLVEIFKLHPLVAQVIIIAVTVCSSYFAHKHFTFRL